ncbi:MAG: hypothetical protein ACXVLQ_06335 [Bacteriovorax sp.]
MKWPILLILSITSISSSFAEEENRCFRAIQKHITEAIEHNKSVALRYATLSDGKSKRLSSTLITLEKISRLLVKNIERESRVYQENGIALLCDEVPDMKKIPEFKDRLPEELRPVDFYQYDYKGLDQNLKNLMKEDLLDEAYRAIAIDLGKLEEQPNQQCLTRHFLESMALTLKLSKEHREEAKKKGLPDPLTIIKKFMTLQRSALFFTHYLDTQAFPLQKEGLLIYCQDVPAANWK